MMTKLLSILLVLITIAGCSTSIRVKQIKSEAVGAGKVKPIPGIPFRVKDTYIIHIYRKDGSKYVKKGQLVKVLPNPKKLFTVNFTARQFADQKLQVDLRNDNTLGKLDLSTAIKADKAIKSLGSSGINIAQALVDLEKAKEEAEVSEYEQQMDELKKQKEMIALKTELLTAKENLRLAEIKEIESPLKEIESNQAEKERLLEEALKELQAAEKAELALNTLSKNAKPENRRAAEAALRLARLKTNHAFRKAGLNEPFPDVFPNDL